MRVGANVRDEGGWLYFAMREADLLTRAIAQNGNYHGQARFFLIEKLLHLLEMAYRWFNFSVLSSTALTHLHLGIFKKLVIVRIAPCPPY